MMKKFIVSSLFASLLFCAPVQANDINGNNDNCITAKSAGVCPNQLGQNVNPRPPRPHGLPRPPFHPPAAYGDGYGWHHRQPGGVFFNFQVSPSYDNYGYDSGRRCSEIARSLRYSGFRQVRPIRCGGRNYIYTAFRNGESLRLTVSSNSGRILNIRPIY